MRPLTGAAGKLRLLLAADTLATGYSVPHLFTPAEFLSTPPTARLPLGHSPRQSSPNVQPETNPEPHIANQAFDEIYIGLVQCRQADCHQKAYRFSFQDLGANEDRFASSRSFVRSDLLAKVESGPAISRLCAAGSHRPAETGSPSIKKPSTDPRHSCFRNSTIPRPPKE